MTSDFVWGVATAAYQVEGGAAEGGRGFSIWDAFCRIPGRVRGMDNGDVACDSYHRFEQDIAMIKLLGARAYRFSIAWPRIQPTGRGAPNPEGIAYYDRLIDALLAAGITPYVTLYHWDLPLDLQMSHDGWLKRAAVDDFAAYAKICFDRFGDRVKHWITLNEPWCVAVLGHGLGVFPPGRTDPDEPYLVAHHLLLAHARAVQLFREGGYGGVIGLSNNCDWREPLSDSPRDREAAQRALEFCYGWFTDPVVRGDYPAVMRTRLGRRLPDFTRAEAALLKNSVDFLGLNHYSSLYASEPAAGTKVETTVSGNGGLSDDQQVCLSADPTWEKTDMQWNVVPWGFRKLLAWVAGRYPGYPIYVTENGCAVNEPDAVSALIDEQRCRFIHAYTEAMRAAIEEDHTDVRGYFCWSLLDNFEWGYGYSKRFGLIRCSPDNLERVPKKSFFEYQRIIRSWFA
ncbi:MAG: GH1 family beta-glucosidase [Kiritimatiellae bacterium]|nr:GH1 family beta-glucosidase [Kiritimatiellia bacterium]